MCKTVKDVLNSIVQKAHFWIKFPCSCKDINIAKSEWLNCFQFFSCTCVLDWTHVRILKHKHHCDGYINNKDLASFNVQPICIVNEYFTIINPSCPSSAYDNRIRKNSKIRAKLTFFNNCVLLGNSAYGLEPRFMTPYNNPQTTRTIKYNILFKSIRVIIYLDNSREDSLSNNNHVDLCLKFLNYWIMYNSSQYSKVFEWLWFFEQMQKFEEWDPKLGKK